MNRRSSDFVRLSLQGLSPICAWIDFESLAPLKITRFEPHTIFDGGDKVFVLITSDATAQGKSYSFPNNGHLWQFKCGREGRQPVYVRSTPTTSPSAKTYRAFPPTRAGVLQCFQMLLAAFPDVRMVPQDVIASGDKAVARVRVTGTHRGPFMGMPATGKRVEVELIDIIRFGDDGRAREHWGVVDQLAMMQQLGAIPAGPQA